MKRRRKKALMRLLALFGLLVAVLLSSCGTAESSVEGDYLFTVDGYGVSKEEFQLFLGNQKAVTANYFWTKYQVQPDADFWTTSFDGETPIGYAKQLALDAMVKSKVEFILAAEREILPYLDYDDMLEHMEEENADRAQKSEAGEVFYGLTQFQPFTYYEYLSNNVRSALEQSQRDLDKPTDAELRRIYEENQNAFSLGTVYEYEIVYQSGEREHVSQNDHEIGKEDTTTEDILLQLDFLAEGEVLQAYNYRGETVDITYLGKAHQGYTAFEDARDSLTALYARQTLSELVQTRVENAEIVFDRAQFDAVEME